MTVLCRRGFSVLAGLWALGGCSASLLPKAPAAAARYTLDDGGVRGDRPQPPPQPPPPPGAPVLLVAQPSAAAGFDTVQMVYLQSPQRLESFAFHEWVEPPARMLAPRLLQALQATGAFRAVLMAPTVAVGDLRLECGLIRLQQDFTVRPSQVRLTLRAVLVQTKTRRVVAAQTFDETAAALGDDPVAGVAAAQRVTRLVLVALAAACRRWAQSTGTSAF
jgi:cholesterol transport system auxiliary component